MADDAVARSGGNGTDGPRATDAPTLSAESRLTLLQQRLRDLEAERDAAQNQCASAERDLNALDLRLRSLEGYVQHKPECVKGKPSGPTRVYTACTCGLASLISPED